MSSAPSSRARMTFARRPHTGVIAITWHPTRTRRLSILASSAPLTMIESSECLTPTLAVSIWFHRRGDVHRMNNIANNTVTCLYSADRVLCERCPAFVTELGVRRQFGAARPTRQPRRGQSTATIPAGVHVSMVSPQVNDVRHIAVPSPTPASRPRWPTHAAPGPVPLPRRRPPTRCCGPATSAEPEVAVCPQCGAGRSRQAHR